MCRRIHRGIGAGRGRGRRRGGAGRGGPGGRLPRPDGHPRRRARWRVLHAAGSATTARFDRWEAAGRPDILDQAREAAHDGDRGPPADPVPGRRRGGARPARAAGRATTRRRRQRRDEVDRCATRRPSCRRTSRRASTRRACGSSTRSGSGSTASGRCPLLADAGARVDADAGIARIPRAVVEAALAPRATVVRPGRPEPGASTTRCPSPVTRYAIDGTAAFVRDFETGERRYGTRRDITEAMRVLQVSRHGRDGLAAGGGVRRPARGAAAAPRVRGDARRPARSTASTSSTRANRRRTSRPSLAAVAGGEAAVRSRHEASVIYCPVAPLVHDGPMLDAYLDLGDLDVPVMIMPMPIPGTTGPASLLGEPHGRERRGPVVDRRVPARPPGPAGDLQQRRRVDGLPERRVPRRDPGDGHPVRGADVDGPLLRPAGHRRRVHVRRPRARTRGRASRSW